MERLTEKRNGTNVIPLRNAICGTDMPYWKITTAGDLTEYLSGNAADRLAAYEDTGLEPEEIKQMCALARLNSNIFDNDFGNHIAEMIVAEQDGRLLVLPCKAGDTVYTIDIDCRDNPDPAKMCFCWNKSCRDCDKSYFRVWENHTKTANIRSIVAEMGLCGETGGFGKTVFLTRKAAEKALEAMQ